MICPECGRANPDTNSWCSICGSDLRNAQPQTIAPVGPSTPVAPGNSPRLALKKVASSPVFLIAAILTALTPILALLFTATGGYTDTFRSVLEMYRAMGLGDVVKEIEPILDQTYGTSMLLGQVVGMLPTVLMVLALFLIFGSAKSSDGTRPMSTAGLTILQVMMIISLVSVGLAALLCVLLLIVLLIVAANLTGEAASALIVVAAVLFVLMAAIIAFSIFYYVGIIRSIRAAKDVCELGRTDRKPSMFVAVIGFISGGSNAISGLSSIASVAFAPAVIFNVLSVLSSAAAMILFSVCLIQFRSALASAQTAPLAPTPYGPYPTNPYMAGYLPPQQPQWQPQQPQWQAPQQSQWQQPSQQSQWRSSMPNDQ